MSTLPTEAPAKQPKPGVRSRSKMERQDRISLAARQLFAELGYDATTLRQIAAAAGLGLGTLFNYVNDKRDLIYLIFNEEMDELTDKALAAPRSWQSFSARILRVTEPHYRLFASEPTLARILLSEILLQSPGLHLERYRAIRNRLIEGLAEIVRTAQQSGEVQSREEPAVIALQIFFTFSGALRWWLASAEQPEWRAGQREFERLLRVLVQGLAPNPEAAAREAVGGTTRGTELRAAQGSAGQ